MAMESAARKFDTSKSEDAEIVSEEKRSPEDVWAGKYWEKIKEENPDPKNAEAVRKETEKILSGDLENALKTGKLELSVFDQNLTDLDREKIFAYSKFAKDNKYKIGAFKLDESGTKVSAEISKERGKVIDFNAYKERISDLFSPEVKVAGAKKAMEIFSESLKNAFEFGKDKIRGVNVDPKEILSKFDKKKIFGTKAKNFLGGMAVGAVTRASVKWATGLAGGVFVGVASGAIAGGTWEGIKAYRAESKKIQELFAKKEELYKRAEQIGKENIGLKESLDKYFEFDVLEQTLPELSKDKKGLYKELVKELGLNSERWKSVKKGAVKGAIMGGLGGALGGVVGNYLGEYFQGSSEAGAAIKEGKRAIGKEAFEQIQSEVTDTYSKTYEKITAAGLANLDMQEFKITARPGDSATTISRRLFKNFIAGKIVLGDYVQYSPEELVIAEDMYKNEILAQLDGKTMQPGETFTGRGANLRSTLERAAGYSDAGKANVRSEFVSKISKSELESMMDYSPPSEEASTYSKAVLEEAEQKATAAISVHDVTEGIGADAAQRIHDKIRDKAVAKAIEQGKNSFFENLFSTVGAAYLAEQGEVVERYINRKRKAKEPVREYRHADDFNEGDSGLMPERKPETEYVELKKEDAIRGTKEFEKDERTHVKPIGLENYEYVEDPDVELKEAKPEKKLEAKTETKPKKEKSEKKIPDDQVFKYFEDKGIAEKFMLKPDEIKYKVRTPNTVKIFSSYEKMARWFNSLSQKKKEWLWDQEVNANEPAIKMDLPDRLQEFMKASELNRASFNAEVDRLIKDMFGVRESATIETPRKSEEKNAAKIPGVIALEDLTPEDEYYKDNSDWTEEEFRKRINRETKDRNLRNLTESLGERELEKKKNNLNEDAA